MLNKDYYRILEVDATATGQEIRSAFRRLARRYHPDVNPDDSQAGERIKDVVEAYHVLGNPEERAKYDRQLRRGRPRPRHEASQPDDSVRRQRAARLDEQDLIQFIIRQFRAGTDRLDIIYEVCIMADMLWPEAEAFVHRVQGGFWLGGAWWQRARIVATSILISIALVWVTIAFTSWYTQITSDHVTQNVSSLQIGSANNQVAEWRRIRWVEAGQTLIVHYDVTARSGALTIAVYRAWASWLTAIPNSLRACLSEVNLKESCQGSIEIPITESGNYELYVNADSFEGHLDVSWQVQP